ncbi:MAG: hypothetical protein JWL65_966 [Gammaproteobacteria bacterium]|nr:hypothetical protein [Gammaproteobacteria bacterium]
MYQPKSNYRARRRRHDQAGSQRWRRSLAMVLVSCLTAALLETTPAESEPSTPQAIAASSPIHSMAARKTTTRAPLVAGVKIGGALINHGGPVQPGPIVYVVYWGWTTDPSGEQAYLNDFLSTIGGTTWLGVVNQYGGGNPQNILAGTWSDPSAVPAAPTDAQIQAEAYAAAIHFQLSANVNQQVVVALPPGHDPTWFPTNGGSTCANHGGVPQYQNVTYTALPYMTDGGSAIGCGVNWLGGALDGVSIVEGHELAESITDPLITAWYDASRNEVADKCAWINVTPIQTSLGTFPVQPLWSNAQNDCVLAEPVNGLAAPATITADWKDWCPSLGLTWSASAGATFYHIAWEIGSSWTGSLTDPGTSPNYTDTTEVISGFAIGTHYAIKVSACNASGCSNLSTVTKFVVPTKCQ